MKGRSVYGRRVVAVSAFLLGAVIVIVGQYAGIMLGSDTSTATREVRVPRVERGPILDREGRILAIHTELDTVTAWTPDVDQAQETASILSSILDLSEADILERITSRQGFVIIKRTITPTQSREIEEQLDAGALSGILLRPDLGRTYPEGEVASTIVGYVGVDNRGLGGIEYSLDALLSPSPTSEDGNMVFGNQVFLTIDTNIQYTLQSMGREALETHDADAVMMVAMDARNGEILSMVSLPNFDPNNFADYPETRRRNKAVSMIYEPGSVFKVYSLASFLDLGGIGLNDYFNTSGSYRNQTAGFEITDLGNYGTINAEGIIKYSSNVGAAYASETVSSESFYRILKDFGFGERTGITLNGEERALLRRPSAWSGRTQQTIAIGQEIGVTAIQMVTAATAFANNGVLLQPRIVRKIVSPDGRTIELYDREPVREVISPSTAQLMLRLMESATESDGTARRLQVPGVRVSAKTGTAEVFDPELGAYSPDDFVASCLAVFPSDNPQLIVYAVIVHPRGESIFGGRIAVPLVRDAADFLVSYLGIPRSDEEVEEHDGRVAVALPVLPEFSRTVPNLVGLPKRSLLPLIDADGLEVVINGSGWVVDQDPPAGSPLRRGMTITVDLE
jgi:cell division protein FtsI (penicillin-binding protein 3)